MWHAGPEGGARPGWAIDARTLLFLLAALIFLYGILFVPPLIPIDYGIDGILLANDGKRMYEGETMYRDFFQFVTPGTGLVYFLLFQLLGLRLWIPDLTLLLLGFGLAALGVTISKKLISPGLALLPSAIFLAGLYKNGLDPTHHWYSLLTAMAAVAAVMERRTPARIAAAGFFCGLSACFTLSRGLAAAIGFVVFLWWESRQKREQWRGLLKQETCLAAGFLATLIAVNSYFVWEVGLTRFLWYTVVFGIKYYPKGNGFLDAMELFPAFPSLHRLLFSLPHRLFLCGVIPLIYLLFFIQYLRQRGKKPTEFWVRPMLLAQVGTFMLLSVAPAPSLLRVASSAMPGVILLGWFIDSPGKFARTLAGLLIAGVLLIVPHAVATQQSSERQILTTQLGKLAVADPVAYEEMVWTRQHTQPSDYLYYMALRVPESFYLNLRNPTPVPFVEPDGYTTQEQVEQVVRGLEQHAVRYILLRSSVLQGGGQ